MPTLYADLLCTFDGLKGFHARRVGLQLVPAWPLERPWDPRWSELLKIEDTETCAEQDGFVFDYQSMLACAWGRPSLAFGPMYTRYDSPMRVARLPGPPYHFMSRVTSIDGPINEFKAGRNIEIAYDIPADEWYFDENGCGSMPFAVLLEAALQPCGWLASAVGSALTVEEELSFRNLDGTGTLHKELLRNAGTMRTQVKITNISKSAGMIIESFDVNCFLNDDTDPVYTLQTVFGFFPLAAFENQAGLPTDDAQRDLLTRVDPSGEPLFVDMTTQPEKYCGSSPRLARPMLNMLDRIAGYWPDGGAAGLGQARGEKDVTSDEWFFKAHFFQDPSSPNGLEALLQVLQFMMIEQGMHVDAETGEPIEGARFEPLMTGTPMTWKYRGQVVPKNSHQPTVEITEVGVDGSARSPSRPAPSGSTGSGLPDDEHGHAHRLDARPAEAGTDLDFDDTEVVEPDGGRRPSPDLHRPRGAHDATVDLSRAVEGPIRARSMRVHKWVTVEDTRTLKAECISEQDGRAKVEVDAESGEAVAEATFTR